MNTNRFSRYLILVLFVLTLCFSTRLNSTGVPMILTFEGTFIDSKEGIIQGIKKIDISINEGADPEKNSQGNVLWQEGFKSVYVTQGFISLELGHITDLDPSIFEKESLYFVIRIEGIQDPEFIPLYYEAYSAVSASSKTVDFVKGTNIYGIVPTSNLIGDYPGISSIGSVSTFNINGSLVVSSPTLIVSSQLKKIGIGVAIPEEILDVNGSIKINVDGIIFPDNQLMVTAATRNVTDRIEEKGHFTLSADNIENGDGYLDFVSGVTSMLRISNSGNIGFQNTNPRVALDVGNELIVGTSTIMESGTIQLSGNQLVGFDGFDWKRLSHQTNHKDGWSLNTEHKVITSISPTNRIGIGTHNPSENLEVEGDVQAVNFEGSFLGNGSEIDSIYYGQFYKEIPVTKGGTDKESFNNFSILLGDEARSITESASMGQSFLIFGNPSGNTTVGFVEGRGNFDIDSVSGNLEVSINKITQTLRFDSVGPEFNKSSGPFVFDLEGNVGINTDTPVVKLDINGGLIIGDTDDSIIGSLRYRIVEDEPTVEAYRNGNWFRVDNLRVAGGWTEEIQNKLIRLTEGITKVGIGHSEPSTSLDINGGFKIGMEVLNQDEEETGLGRTNGSSNDQVTELVPTGVQFNSELSRFQGYKVDWELLDITPEDGYLQKNGTRLTTTVVTDTLLLGDAFNPDYMVDSEGTVNGTGYLRGGVLFPWELSNDNVSARVDYIGIGGNEIEGFVTLGQGTGTLATLKLGVSDDQLIGKQGAIAFDGKLIHMGIGSEPQTVRQTSFVTEDDSQSISNKTIQNSELADHEINGKLIGELFVKSVKQSGLMSTKFNMTKGGDFYVQTLNAPPIDVEFPEDFDEFETSFDSGIRYLPGGTMGAIVYESNFKNFYFSNGTDWFQLNYDILNDGPFIRLYPGQLSLLEAADRLVIGDSLDTESKLSIAGTINSGGYYKNGDELPWIKKSTTVYLENEKVAIGSTGVDENYLLDVSGPLNASNYKVNGEPIPPAGATSGGLVGLFPGPELAKSGVVSGTYGTAQLNTVFHVNSKGLIVDIGTELIAGVLPGGGASGDLSSVYPSPVVSKIRGFSIISDAPSNKNSLVWDSSTEEWKPTQITAVGTAGGRLTGTYPSPEIAASGVVASTYSSHTALGRLNVDSSGFIIDIVTRNIENVPPAGNAGGDLEGNYPNPILVDSTVTPGQYGSDITFGQFVVGSDGFISSATTINLGEVEPGGPAGGRLSSDYPLPELEASGVIAGDYGQSTMASIFSVDETGLITSASSVTITGVRPGGAAGEDLAGNFPSPTLALSGVTEGTYGSSTEIPIFQVNEKGIITSANSVHVADVGPGGSAGGDLGATYPNTSVLNVQGIDLSTTVPVNGSSLVLSQGKWAPVEVTAVGNAGGDLSGTYPNPNLATSGVTSGLYGTATRNSVFEVDSKGRLTSVSLVAIENVTPAGSASGDLSGSYPEPVVSKFQTFPVSSATPSNEDALVWDGDDWVPGDVPITGVAGGSNDLSGNYPNPSLSETGVTSGTYGTATQLGRFEVDSKGRIISVSNQTISGVLPGGAAGGDLSGTYPNPVVSKLRGRSISSDSPSDNYSLVWNGSVWEPTLIQASGPASGVLSGTFPNPTLAASEVSAGSYGDAQNGYSVTVLNSGIISVASSVGISGVSPGGTAGGSLSGAYPNPDLATSNVMAGTYGTATSVNVFTVSAKGLITAASSIAIDGVTPTGSTDGSFTGTFPNPVLKTKNDLTSGFYGTVTSVPKLIVGSDGFITSSNEQTISGVLPGGIAVGDLSGSYPSPVVSRLKGVSLNVTAPLNGETYIFTTDRWKPGIVDVSGVAGGDFDGAYPSPVLVTRNGLVPLTTFGNATHVPVVTVDSKGLITAVTEQLVSNVLPGGTASGDLSGDYPGPVVSKLRGNMITEAAPSNGDSYVFTSGSWVAGYIEATGSAGGVFQGTFPNPTLSTRSELAIGIPYGNSTHIPIFEVDEMGLVITINEQLVSGVLPGGTAGNELSGTYPNPIVIKFRGVTINAVAPTDNDTLVYQTDEWVPGKIPPTGNASGVLAGSYPNPTLANVTQNVSGIKGNARSISQLTIDSSGQIVDVATVNIYDVTPLGTASGDFSGSYPNPTVIALNGIPLSTDPPQNGDTLTYISGELVPDPINAYGNLAGGDLEGSFPSPNLIVSGVTSGNYGVTNQIAQFTVDAKGRITDVTNVLITHANPGGAVGGADFVGNYPNIELKASGVTAGSYGAEGTVPVIEVNSKGFVTSVTEVGLIAEPIGPAGGKLSGTYPNPTLNVSGVSVNTYGTYKTDAATFYVGDDGIITTINEVALWGVIPGGPAGNYFEGSTFPDPVMIDVDTIVTGSYGASTNMVQLTVSANGLVTTVAIIEDLDPASPGGSAGGDLGGYYPNPVRAKLNGYEVESGTPQPVDVLRWKESLDQWLYSNTSVDTPWTYSGTTLSFSETDVVMQVTGIDSFMVGTSSVSIDDSMSLTLPPQDSLFSYWTNNGSLIVGRDSKDKVNIKAPYAVAFGRGYTFSTGQKGNASLSGYNNVLNGEYSSATGYKNTAKSDYSTVTGETNYVQGDYSSMFSGQYSNFSGDYSVVYTGSEITFGSGTDYVVIMGSTGISEDSSYTVNFSKSNISSSSSHDYAMSGGYGSKSAGQGTFLWRDNDVEALDYSSDYTDSFVVAVSNGVRIKSDFGFGVFGTQTSSSLVDPDVSFSFSTTDGVLFVGNETGDSTYNGTNSYFQTTGSGSTIKGETHFLSGYNIDIDGKRDAAFGAEHSFSATSGGIDNSFHAGYDLDENAYSYTFANNMMIGKNLKLEGSIVTGSVFSETFAAGMHSGTQVTVNETQSFFIDTNIVSVNATNLYYSGTWHASSDKRFKKNVRGFNNITSKLMGVDSVTFEWKDSYNSSHEGVNIGFVAQNLKPLFPELTLKDSNGYYRVSYDLMYPVVIKGVQEQQVTIGKLSYQTLVVSEGINVMATELDDLESRLSRLENL
ncbi:hypothetical protein HOH45_01335 [bacterium]|nr:hypothetical protein [bacterium]